MKKKKVTEVTETTPKAPESKFPTSKQLENELKRISQGGGQKSPIKTLLTVLIISGAIVVLLTSLLFPVVKITGSAMQPTLNNDDISLAIKTQELEYGDLVCFYNNNNLLVRRVIGMEGDVVDVLEDGSLLVNGERVNERYISEKALGDPDITFPYTVPDHMYFVMGDNRPAAKDSRHAEISCIPSDHIAGKLFVTIWPVYDIKLLNQK